MKITKFLFGILSIVLIIIPIIGCKPSNEQEIEITLTSIATLYTSTLVEALPVTLTPMHTPEVTAIILPTITPFPPTATLSTTSTPTIHPEVQVNFKCLNISNQVPPESSIEASLFIQGFRGDSSYIWNIDMDNKYIFPVTENDTLLILSASPDGNWLAYQLQKFDSPGPPSGELLSWELIIVSVDGKQKFEYTWEEEWLNIESWIDNESLNISTLDGNISLNPFTGEKKQIPPLSENFPNRNDIDTPWTLVFNPIYNLVVYPDFDGNYIILDYVANQEIAKVSFPSLDNRPQWSPDGEQFVISNVTKPWPADGSYIPNAELYSVSRNGEVTRLTNFSPYFASVYIHDYVWSPDGDFIAFWVEFNTPEIREDNLTLAVLDTSSGGVTNYCLKASYKFGVNTPVWSLSGQQLLIKAFSENETSQLVLIDIKEGFAIRIAGDILKAGWMAPFP